MQHIRKRDAAFWLASAGLLVLVLAMIGWRAAHPEVSVLGQCAAALSAALFAGVGLRLSPELVRFWSPDAPLPAETPEAARVGFLPKLFLALLGWDALVVLLAWPLRCLLVTPETLSASLDAWVCGDGVHYLDIARDWYLSSGSVDRLVQLVFLPGYPLLVRLMHVLVRNWSCAALAVSALCFAGAGCVLYRLFCLDAGHAAAVRGVALLCLTPGSFFFAAPMSESLFLLCCISCIYLARTGRWLPGCAMGAAAAFTRSLGITLLVPLLTELIALAAHRAIPRKALVLHGLCLGIVPLGLIAYLWINYRVAGDPFQFLTYQSEHWHQQLGLFFHTASYQTEYAVDAARENVPNLLGLWLPNLLAQALSLGLMIYGAKHLRASDTAWYMVYFCIAIGTTWLLSAPRYLMAFFPAALVLSRITARKGLRSTVMPVMLGLWCLYFFVFLLRWQVY